MVEYLVCDPIFALVASSRSDVTSFTKDHGGANVFIQSSVLCRLFWMISLKYVFFNRAHLYPHAYSAVKNFGLFLNGH